jgi:hypothetical protein
LQLKGSSKYDLAMAQKSVATKLGLKAGRTLLVRSAPGPIADLLGALPDGAAWVDSGSGPFPMILVFARNRAAMIKELPAAKSKLEPGGILWIAYAKGTSDKATDINRDSIREHVASIGLNTVAQIAIDDDWSALRLKVVA